MNNNAHTGSARSTSALSRSTTPTESTAAEAQAFEQSLDPSSAIARTAEIAADFAPTKLTTEQWSPIAAEVAALTAPAVGSNQFRIRNWLSTAAALVAFIVGPKIPTSFSAVLTDTNIVRFLDHLEAQGAKPNTLANHRRCLDGMIRVRAGLPPVTPRRRLAPGSAPHSGEEIEGFFELASCDEIAALAVGIIAGAGGGLVCAEGVTIDEGGNLVTAAGDRADVLPAYERHAVLWAGAKYEAQAWTRVQRRLAKDNSPLPPPLMPRLRACWVAAQLVREAPAALTLRDPRLARRTIERTLPHVDVATDADVAAFLRELPCRNLVTRRHPPAAGAEGAPVVKKLSKAEMRRLREQFTSDQTPSVAALPEALEQWLVRYAPRDIPADRWDRLRPFVLEILRRSGTQGPESLRRHTSTLVGYADWAFKRNRPLSASELLTYASIDDYIAVGLDHLPERTRSDYRARLRRLAQVVNPGEQAPVTRRRLRHADVKAPHSGAEVAALVRMAKTQPSAIVRRQLCACVGLGFGAGLDSADLRELRRRDIEDRGEGGITISIRHGRERTVTVARRFEDLVREGIAGLAPGALVIGKVDTRRNIAGAVYEQAVRNRDSVRPEQARMRSTWLAWLMTEPVPLAVILKAAGLQSARTLTDLLPHVDVDDDPVLLRGGDR